jgi:hypothetical protein
MIKILVGIVFSVLVLGCGQNGNNKYKLSCEHVECPDADDTKEIANDPDKTFYCTWGCTSYNGDEDVYVTLTFQSLNGSCWVLVEEYVTDGNCT